MIPRPGVKTSAVISAIQIIYIHTHTQHMDSVRTYTYGISIPSARGVIDYKRALAINMFLLRKLCPSRRHRRSPDITHQQRLAFPWQALLSVKANSGWILDSVNGYRRIKFWKGKMKELLKRKGVEGMLEDFFPNWSIYMCRVTVQMTEKSKAPFKSRARAHAHAQTVRAILLVIFATSSIPFLYSIYSVRHSIKSQKYFSGFW